MGNLGEAYSNINQFLLHNPGVIAGICVKINAYVNYRTSAYLCEHCYCYLQKPKRCVPSEFHGFMSGECLFPGCCRCDMPIKRTQALISCSDCVLEHFNLRNRFYIHLTFSCFDSFIRHYSR